MSASGMLMTTVLLWPARRPAGRLPLPYQPRRLEPADEVLDVLAGGVDVDRVLLGEGLRRLSGRAAVEEGPQDQRAGGVEGPVLAALGVQQRRPVVGVGGGHPVAQPERHGSSLSSAWWLRAC